MPGYLEAFRAALLAKDNTREHAELTLSRVTAACRGSGFKRLADLTCEPVNRWLKSQRESVTRFSVHTSNHYLVALKNFGNWLVKAERIGRNPFANLTRLNAKVDVRHQRRALTPSELTRLIQTTSESPSVFRGLNGTDRAMLYLLAVTTGLRVSELGSLTAKSFDLDAVSPTVTIAPKDEKARRGATLPIRPDIADKMRGWLATRPALSQKLWPGTWVEKAAKMIRADMMEAWTLWLSESEDSDDRANRDASDFLKEETSDGLADFHLLRHTFISMLAISGVNPKVAQQLARHSTITLTMDRYTHLPSEQLTRAVGLLPDLSEPNLSQTGITGPVVLTTSPSVPKVCQDFDSDCNALITLDEVFEFLRELPDEEYPDDLQDLMLFMMISNR